MIMPFGDYQVTSLTGWSKYNNDRLTDSDFLSVDYLTTTYDSDYEQTSQELRLTSPTGERLEYIAGLFYLDSDMDYSNGYRCQFSSALFTVGSSLGHRQLENL